MQIYSSESEPKSRRNSVSRDVRSRTLGDASFNGFGRWTGARCRGSVEIPAYRPAIRIPGDQFVQSARKRPGQPAFNRTRLRPKKLIGTKCQSNQRSGGRRLHEASAPCSAGLNHRSHFLGTENWLGCHRQDSLDPRGEPDGPRAGSKTRTLWFWRSCAEA
jgi:hypothetical protein